MTDKEKHDWMEARIEDSLAEIGYAVAEEMAAQTGFHPDFFLPYGFPQKPLE